MRITWVTRSFLDYRIPVFKELNDLCGNQLSLIYYRDVVPERCQNKVASILGDRAKALSGELRLSGQKSAPASSIKRKGVRIPWQPGVLKAISDTKPECLISDGLFQWTYATLLQRVFKHIPHVVCYEPTPHTERNTQWFRTAYRKIASHWVDAFCCNGVLCKEYTISLGVIEDKIFTGSMAADSDNLSISCKNITASEIEAFTDQHKWKAPVFLYVGRLVELKGIIHLLRAWKKANINGTLVLVGDGNERMTLEQYCQQEDLSNVVLTGNIDYDSLAIYYRCSDVFIIPTLQDNWSLVVPEAMACGLPIACSKYNGCYPELVKPENGWVFNPLNCDKTAEMLKQIVDSQDKFSSMGEASQRIVADFSPANAANIIYLACQKANNNK